ncbi:DUF1380 domain-containing protein (plasmid) [Citrobacter cronae]|uniref:DUF1380 domain-containing protein n=1 Tax=Enterobacteriaceae TaxID=543 RepID=UPI0021824B0C|nr:DUF1380 domain-containing protein [Citrobacter freundii]UVD61942.1 hypothetical protein [Citrobacter freundii]
MLYGNRKELNKKLKRMFGNDERYALLVWTKEDVMEQVEGMTEAEADALLALIGRMGMGEHTEEGVSFHTVQALYAGIQGDTPRVSVPADTLARITDIAARAISGEDAQAWPLVQKHYPSVADAQKDIAWLENEIAA